MANSAPRWLKLLLGMIVVCALSAMLGCGGDDDDDDDSTTTDTTSSPEPTSTPSTTETPAPSRTIYDLNQSPPDDNTPVTVQGVVTAIDYSYNFWIEDPAGGSYSGIYVYDKPNTKGKNAGIAIGDLVEVTGLFVTYYDLREISVYEEESEGMVTIIEMGAGTPAPIELEDLAPLRVQELCQSSPNLNLEQYVGVLLKFPVTTVSSGVGACESNPTYGIWEVEDEAGDKHLVDDDTFSYSPVVDAKVELTGVLHYSYQQYKLEPTEINDDFEGNPTPTPAPDPTGISIYDLNQEKVADNTVITTTGIVTATTAPGNFWIQDADGGQYSGIYIYDSSSKKGQAAGIAVGDEVTVTGRFQHYYDMREIVVESDEASGAVVIAEAGVGVPAAMVLYSLEPLQYESMCSSDPVDSVEPYVGVLMELPTAAVSSGIGACGTETSNGVWEVADTSDQKLLIDDWVMAYEPVEQTEVEVSGILSYTYSQYRLQATSINGEGGATPTPFPELETTPISELNQNPPENDTPVKTNGIITAYAANGSFWVQESEGGLFSGIYVFDPTSTALSGEFAVGDRVELEGSFTVYHGLHEFSLANEASSVTLMEAGVGVPAPMVLEKLSPLHLESMCETDNVEGLEGYVGILLELPTGTVSSGLGACDTDVSRGVWEISDADGDKVLVDDWIMDFEPVVESEVSAKGILSFTYSQYRLQATEVDGEEVPTPTPEVTPEPTPGETPEATQEPTPEDTPVPTPDETPEATPVESPTPVATPVESPTPEASPVESPTPEATPVESPTPETSPVESPTPETTPVESPTPETTPVESPTPTPAVQATVQELNTSPPEDGTLVETEAYITAFDQNNNFWIQEGTGGLNSGIYVFDPGKVAANGGLTEGRCVRISARFKTYHGLRELSLDSSDSSTWIVEQLNCVGPPQAMVLEDLSGLQPADRCNTEIDSALEPYVGILVTLPTTTVSSELGACDTSGKGVWEVADESENKLLIDDWVVPYTPTLDSTLNISGILSYTYSQYRLQATEIEDLSNPAPDSYTIYELNQSPLENDSPLSTTGIVTGIQGDGSFWIQDTAGGLYSGIFVFDRYENKGLAAGMSIGDEVSVVGTFKTYYGLREISIPSDSSGSVTLLQTGVGAPQALALSDLSVLQVASICETANDSNVEPYVGILLELPTTTVASGFGACDSTESFGLWMVGDGSGNQLMVDDSVGYSYVPNVGDTVDITGILTYNYSEYRLEPLGDEAIIVQ